VKALLVLFFTLTGTAHMRVAVPVAGVPVSIPLPWLELAAVALTAAVLLLWLIRSAVRDGGFWRLRPRMVTT